MNAPDKIPFADQFALSREPFPASRKVYVPGSQASIQVPMREILLSNGAIAHLAYHLGAIKQKAFLLGDVIVR